MIANTCWEAAIGSLRIFVVLYFTVGLGLSLTTTSAALALVGVGALIAAPVAGKLADRYGPRPVIQGATWVFVAGLLPTQVTSSSIYSVAIVPVAFAAVVLITLPYTLLVELLPQNRDHGVGAGCSSSAGASGSCWVRCAPASRSRCCLTAPGSTASPTGTRRSSGCRRRSCCSARCSYDARTRSVTGSCSSDQGRDVSARWTYGHGCGHSSHLYRRCVMSACGCCSRWVRRYRRCRCGSCAGSVEIVQWLTNDMVGEGVQIEDRGRRRPGWPRPWPRSLVGARAAWPGSRLQPCCVRRRARRVGR